MTALTNTPTTKVVQPAEVAPAAEVTESVVDREVGAAFLASGIGSLALGILILLTEMKAGAGLKSALAFNSGVGPLSGKTTVAVVAFVLGWIGLHFALRNRQVKLMTSFIITIILVALGMLFSFPPFFELFAN